MFPRITIRKLKRIFVRILLVINPFYKKIQISFQDTSMHIYGIKLQKNYGLGKDFSRNLCHEPICSEYLIDLLKVKPNSVFWDCGSAIGYYSILAKHASQNKSTVHAFEANSLYNKYINLFSKYNELLGKNIKILKKYNLLQDEYLSLLNKIKDGSPLQNKPNIINKN